MIRSSTVRSIRSSSLEECLVHVHGCVLRFIVVPSLKFPQHVRDHVFDDGLSRVRPLREVSSPLGSELHLRGAVLLLAFLFDEREVPTFPSLLGLEFRRRVRIPSLSFRTRRRLLSTTFLT